MSHTLITYMLQDREFIRIDYSSLTGYEALLAELRIRYIKSNDELPHSFFKRACKRHGLSKRSTLNQLAADMIILTPCLPALVHIRMPFFRTYEGWRAHGYQVTRGSIAYAENSDSVKLFDFSQVTQRTQ